MFYSKINTHTHSEKTSSAENVLTNAFFIQPKLTIGSTNNHLESQAQQIEATKGEGNAMDSSTKKFMESRIGNDFSEVRIHTDNKAIQLSQQLNAHAFTVGNDVYFNKGEYSPNTYSGKQLLAHELTHTVQQKADTNKSIQRKLKVNAGVSLDTFGFSVSKTGNEYTCPRVTKASLWNEIFTSLLHSSRVFNIKGASNTEADSNLKKHMKARLGVVEFAAKKKYTFGAGSNFVMNPAFWDNTTLEPKAGVDRNKAIQDLNVHPEEYQIACQMASQLTMEGGSGSADLATENGVALSDWIPGDWGYITNLNHHLDPKPGYEGENIIYTGKDLFWGHFGAGNTYKTLTEWFDEVESWKGAAQHTNHRQHTIIGLE